MQRLAELSDEDPARSSGITAQMLCSWERDRVTPSLDNVDLLCQLYRTRPDRLGFGRDYSAPEHSAPTSEAPARPPLAPLSPLLALSGLGHPAMDTHPAAPSTPTTDGAGPEHQLTGPAGAGEETAALQHQLLGVGEVQALSAGALDAVAAVRRRLEQVLDRTAPDGELIEHWEERAAHYGRVLYRSSPLEMFGEVMPAFAQAQRELTGDGLVHHRREVSHILAQLGGLVAYCLGAMGEQRETNAWHLTGSRLASMSGDRALHSWLVGQRAIHHWAFCTPRIALDMSRAAQALVGTTRCSTQVLAPALEAAALAALGNGTEARTALRRAEAAFDSGHRALDGQTVFAMAERTLRTMQSYVHAELGHPQATETAIEQALALYPKDYEPARAMLNLVWSTLLLARGDAVAACRHAVDTLTALPPPARESLPRIRARQLLRSLPPEARHHRSTRDLRALLSPAS